MTNAVKDALVVTKSEAVELFGALGINSASKWGPKRLATKLGAIDKVVDDTTTVPPECQPVLALVLEAIEDKQEITVFSADPKDDETPKKVAKKPTKAKGTKPPAGTTAPEGPTGVRATVTRPYLAGKIIAEYGINVGITDEMAKRLDEEYGKANPSESMFALRNAWHAIRGFNDFSNM